MFYHFYFDQGGLFGTPVAFVSETPLTDEEQEKKIPYMDYIGHVSKSHIMDYLRLFEERYLSFKVRFAPDSVFQSVEQYVGM